MCVCGFRLPHSPQIAPGPPIQIAQISSQLGEQSSQLGETVHLTINGSKTNMLIQLHAESFADTQFQNRTRYDFKIGPAAISNRPKMNVQIRAEAVFGLTTDNFQMGPIQGGIQPPANNILARLRRWGWFVNIKTLH